MLRNVRQHPGCLALAGMLHMRSSTQPTYLPSCIGFLHSIAQRLPHSEVPSERSVTYPSPATTTEQIPSQPPAHGQRRRDSTSNLVSTAVPAKSVENLIKDLRNAEQEQSRTRKPARFVDRLRITVQAGKGGNGSASFWASKKKGKYRPADGGSGGNGGDVFLQASSHVKSLNGLNHLHKAGAGHSGGKQKLVGARGKDIAIEVPVGTVVYLPEEDEPEDEELPFWVTNPGEPWIGARDYRSSDDESSEDTSRSEMSSEATLKQRLGREVADLKWRGDRFALARGGEGGRGNASFPSKTNKSGQDLSTAGSPGERVVACLEIRTLADIGLVGAPNAGKSSLLKMLSAATPKVAPYPFTTLQPHLGAVSLGEEVSLTVADIPGLLPGAARNRGLGHAFLRHISRARALVYVVDASGGLEGNRDSPRPWEQLHNLQEELRMYSPELLEKPALVVANKIDRLQREGHTLPAIQRRTPLEVVGMCALPGSTRHSLAAVQDLKERLQQLAA